MTFRPEVLNAAAALYAGGWTSADREQLQEEYSLTDEETEALCMIFLEWETAEHPET